METPEAVFAYWLSERPAADPAELEALVRSHPEMAAVLRALHDRWRRAAKLRPRQDLSGSLAERLQEAHGPGLDPKIELPDEAGEAAPRSPSSRSERVPASERYRLEREVARGGMGAVLQVWDVDLRRHLAMKVLIEERRSTEAQSSMDRRQLARLLEEAQVTAQLDHPGIVPVHELGLGADGNVFFTMKLVKGKTLGDVFEELALGEGGWTEASVLGHLVKVCEAMSYSHAKGVIHRDLKPANVMVGQFGEVYVMDWGLAKILGREDDKDVRVRAEPALLSSEVSSNRRDAAAATPDSPLCTMDGDVLGTPAYMSPEQAKGRISEMGPPSDVYALGAMLYHLLAGHMPYVPRDAVLNNYAVWSHVQSGPPRPLREIAPKAPPELVAICERAMQREPAARYADMRALAADLRAYVEDRVVSAYEAGAWAEARKWIRRNKRLAAALLAVVLLLAAGLSVALVLEQKAQASYELAEARRGETERLNLELESESSRLAAEIGSVKRLSALQDYDELILRAQDLWPPLPSAIDRYEAWIAEARALVADLPLHRAKRNELRLQALAETDAERAADRATDPDLAELQALPGKIASLRAALRRRRDGIAAEAFAPGPNGSTADAKDVELQAWPLVSPGRSLFGRESEGLALAERGLELARSRGNGESLATAGNTLSRALFALGRDAEALSASWAALEAAPEAERPRYASLLSDLERWVEAAESEAGRAQAEAELAALEAEREKLEARAGERRTWTFPDTREGRETRWWHTNLSKLIENLEGLTDARTGLLSEAAEAVSAEEGWSVPRRLAFARRLQSGVSTGGEWDARWKEAAAAIREHPQYGGLELAPQLGLVPIGPNPQSGLWEFWHVATGKEPMRGEDGRLVTTEQTGLVLVLIPAGSFWMGASPDPAAERNYLAASNDDEGPVHEVSLSPFFLSKYEMTQAQWSGFAGLNPSFHKPPSGLAQSLLHPVEQVSWADCMRELPRMGLDLPSEAQWEYACRAGTATPWWTGPERESLRDQRAANLADKSAVRARTGWQDIQDWPELDDGFALHAPVGTFTANPWGLHDVHGNVWEWCRDGYDPRFYASSPKLDPCAPWEGATNRVLRGGCFSDAAFRAFAANRAVNGPTAVGNSIGVRPCRLLSE